MNIASIDIGSNTVLLLIASIENNKLIPIINKYESPRLGKGLQIGGKILDDRIAHLLEILKSYKTLIEEYKCSETILTATNALRIASNSDEILKKVKEDLGFEIKIIPGEEEAALSFMGASSSFTQFEEKVVIDIGGGSTEIIYGNSEEIIFKHSFQTGVVSLTENFIGTYPYSEDSLIRTEQQLKNVFKGLEKEIPSNRNTIAVAGTPTTLSCIKQNLKVYSEEKVESSILLEIDLNELQNKLGALSGVEIKEQFGQVVNGREDVIFAGTLILQYLRRLLSTDKIYVSSRGLRYGNIISYIKNAKAE